MANKPNFHSFWEASKPSGKEPTYAEIGKMVHDYKNDVYYKYTIDVNGTVWKDHSPMPLPTEVSKMEGKANLYKGANCNSDVVYVKDEVTGEWHNIGIAKGGVKFQLGEMPVHIDPEVPDNTAFIGSPSKVLNYQAHKFLASMEMTKTQLDYINHLLEKNIAPQAQVEITAVDGVPYTSMEYRKSYESDIYRSEVFTVYIEHLRCYIVRQYVDKYLYEAYLTDESDLHNHLPPGASMTFRSYVRHCGRKAADGINDSAFWDSNSTGGRKTEIKARHPMSGKTYKNRITDSTEIFPEYVGSIRSIIISLNDRCGWTREQIADWLDTLDEQPTFEPVMGPRFQSFATVRVVVPSVQEDKSV